MLGKMLWKPTKGKFTWNMKYMATVNKTAFLVIYFNDQIALPSGAEI